MTPLIETYYQALRHSLIAWQSVDTVFAYWVPWIVLTIALVWATPYANANDFSIDHQYIGQIRNDLCKTMVISSVIFTVIGGFVIAQAYAFQHPYFNHMDEIKQELSKSQQYNQQTQNAIIIKMKSDKSRVNINDAYNLHVLKSQENQMNYIYNKTRLNQSK